MNKKSKKKWFWIGGAAVVVVGLVVANLMMSGNGAIMVQTKKAFPTDVTAVVSGSGTIQPKTKINITSEVNAAIIGISVKEGDFVSRGQVLLQLDTVQLKTDMESAVYNSNELAAYLEGARVLLNQRQEEYQRQKDLFDKKLTSEQVYKDTYYAWKNQEASVAAMEQQKNAASARLDKARDYLSKTTIRAAMDGIITLIDCEEGEIAQAQTAYSQGKTLMVLSNLSQFEVEVDIDETDIADLEVGQNAKIEIDAFPDTTFAGTVAEIGNTATAAGYGTTDQGTNFKVKAALNDVNPKIRPGMSATVDITTKEHENVLATLIQAIVVREFDPDSLTTAGEKAEPSSGSVAVASTSAPDTSAAGQPDKKKKVEKKGVFVVRDGKAHFVEVQTGIADKQNIEVESGLSKDDEVIIGSFRILRTLTEGAAVKVDNTLLEKEKGNEPD
ncbi:MAG: efflux RND transporter periplasmic adaptor subunit [candidate division Zixibacteria bacterium]|nr:efflux RND transporter periplasmic adaptor subunit [candidate division Zixibacteria bacterium]